MIQASIEAPELFQRIDAEKAGGADARWQAAENDMNGNGNGDDDGDEICPHGKKRKKCGKCKRAKAGNGNGMDAERGNGADQRDWLARPARGGPSNDMLATRQKRDVGMPGM